MELDHLSLVARALLVSQPASCVERLAAQGKTPTMSRLHQLSDWTDIFYVGADPETAQIGIGSTCAVDGIDVGFDMALGVGPIWLSQRDVENTRFLAIPNSDPGFYSKAAADMGSLGRAFVHRGAHPASVCSEVPRGSNEAEIRAVAACSRRLKSQHRRRRGQMWYRSDAVDGAS